MAGSLKDAGVPGKIGVGHFSRCRLSGSPPWNGTQPGLVLRVDPTVRQVLLVFHRVGSGPQGAWDLIGDADAISLNDARGAMLGARGVFLQDVLKGSYAFSKRARFSAV
jgi:hypothetical protein